MFKIFGFILIRTAEQIGSDRTRVASPSAPTRRRSKIVMGGPWEFHKCGKHNAISLPFGNRRTLRNGDDSGMVYGIGFTTLCQF